MEKFGIFELLDALAALTETAAGTPDDPHGHGNAAVARAADPPESPDGADAHGHSGRFGAGSGAWADAQGQTDGLGRMGTDGADRMGTDGAEKRAKRVPDAAFSAPNYGNAPPAVPPDGPNALEGFLARHDALSQKAKKH